MTEISIDTDSEEALGTTSESDIESHKVNNAVMFNKIVYGVILGCTLNIGTGVIVNIGKLKLKWELLTPKQQIEFFRGYIRNVYSPVVDGFEAYWELTAKGNVHCHMVLYIDDDVDKSEYWLNMIRKSVSQNSIVVRMNKGRIHNIVTSNYIHLLKDVKSWFDYIKKAIGSIPDKPFSSINL